MGTCCVPAVALVSQRSCLLLEGKPFLFALNSQPGGGHPGHDP